MRRSDWVPTTTGFTGTDDNPFEGYVRADGQGGNSLFKALPDDDNEARLASAYRALRARYPGLLIARHHAQMPYWQGDHLPTLDDYTLVDAPLALTTTAITVLLVPRRRIADARLGYYFQGETLPPLRDRLQGRDFRGVIGNLGYYMTAGLIADKFRWSHNTRYPDHPLPEIPSYIGFHWCKHPTTGAIQGSFASAHPSIVALRTDGDIEILHQLAIESYTVRFGAQTVQIEALNAPEAVEADIVAFTPALRTPEAEHATANGSWQTYAPFIPLADAADRIHVFIANQSNGLMPQEQVIAVWEGPAPLPSFGAVIAFKRHRFAALFGSVAKFKRAHLNRPVRIVPASTQALDAYQCMMGGLVPAVIDGQHVYHCATVADVRHNLSRFGNATSPIAQTGRETRNFDPVLREPAGLLIQTEHYAGWVLFDGRHELSIGASVVDVALLLEKLAAAGHLAGETVQQALFVDGGSAMKIYAVASDQHDTRLDPLNRTAAGARNGPRPDYEGLNLYSTLALALEAGPEG